MKWKTIKVKQGSIEHGEGKTTGNKSDKRKRKRNVGEGKKTRDVTIKPDNFLSM